MTGIRGVCAMTGPTTVAEIQGIDPQVVALCDAMNSLPGITTVESCCGHGRDTFHVWFKARTFKDLARLSYKVDGCHSGVYGWHIKVWTDCASQLSFLLESQAKGSTAFLQADELASSIRGDCAIGA